MDIDEPDYSKVSHDELLALAAKDSVAAQEFFYRYQYSDVPVLKTEVREVLRSLVEDFEHSSFWPDWYATLRDSNDPKEQRKAEIWRKKILDASVFDNSALIACGVLDAEDISHDELFAAAGQNLASARAFYHRYRHSEDPAVKAEVHSILKSLAVDFGCIGFWIDWYVALRNSDDPAERCESEAWKQKILNDGGFIDEVLISYGLKRKDS